MLEYILNLVQNPPYELLAALAALALALSEVLGHFEYFKESSIVDYVVKYANKLKDWVSKKK